ncbi:MAG: ThiF family adenylyltransferase, partial [Treponema sp.]|nr:ThiF family adenylyltransferase [Treponema sp.]
MVDRSCIVFQQFLRTQIIFGEENMKKLSDSRVIVFGIGGVGGHVVEALVRSGIGAIDIVDNDKVSLTNVNRQIFALLSTVGRYKVDVAEERIRDINPECKVSKYTTFFMPETSGSFDFSQYDYAIDCIDTVTGKIEIIVRANQCGIPVISSMGAGNKIDPTKFVVSDIYKTSVCPLARVMRR